MTLRSGSVHNTRTSYIIKIPGIQYH